MTKTILFLCPHSAAKSVMAAAYCQRLAVRSGLDLTIDFAGTDPDPDLAPAVVKLLQTEGIDVSDQHPKLVDRQMIEAADRIISMGCDVQGLAPEGATIEHWDDVPAPSQGLLTARDLIYARVEHLIDALKIPSGAEIRRPIHINDAAG